MASQEGKITQEKCEGCFWGDGIILCVTLGVNYKSMLNIKTHYLRFVHFFIC